MTTKENEESGVAVATINKVAVKPPIFMESNVAAWFFIMDAQFNIAQISMSSTKFYHVLAALPAEVVGRIPQDILETNDYKKLRDAVIST